MCIRSTCSLGPCSASGQEEVLVGCRLIALTVEQYLVTPFCSPPVEMPSIDVSDSPF